MVLVGVVVTHAVEGLKLQFVASAESYFFDNTALFAMWLPLSFQLGSAVHPLGFSCPE